MSHKSILVGCLVALALGLTVMVVDAQGPRPGGRRSPAALAGTGFTYQGQLKQNGALVNGACAFNFGLWDDPVAGPQYGSTQTVSSLAVTNGLFTTPVDFGGGTTNYFTGTARYLQVAVNCGGGMTTLSPRQPLTPAPYALALPGLYTQQNATSPNVIGGNNGNSVSPGKYGVTVGGGGGITDAFGSACASCYNSINANYATIGGGLGNVISSTGWYATIGGGVLNTASGGNATIAGGGANNTASGNWSTIGGGDSNTASGARATIGGGAINTASGGNATIGGGNGNNASDSYATVGGGYVNTAGSNYATVGGGYSNTASGATATIGGGYFNQAISNIATIGGGSGNTASGNWSTIGGGANNTASGSNATVGGGLSNTASGSAATIGGGLSNTSGPTATVGGGYSNTASGNWSTIGGGYANTVSGQQATIGGGVVNSASNYAATVSGGFNNTASGGYATVPGGFGNTAEGWQSFAAGSHARANHDGAFVWGDSTLADINSSASNQFIARANGGFYLIQSGSNYTVPVASGFFLTTTTGAFLSSGGAWTNASDRNAKANFASVDGQQVLNQLMGLPIQTWNYRAEDYNIRHIGPAAQDFYAAFQLGQDDTHISTIDADGVALAALQGLYRLVQEKDAKIASQQKQIDSLETRVAALEQASAQSPQPPLLRGEQKGGFADWHAALAFVIGAMGVVAIERARKGASK